MKIIEQLLDYSQKWELPDVYMFTANSVVNNASALVMGKGNAKAVKDNYPWSPTAIGSAIEERVNFDDEFGVAFCELDENQFLGAFQTKKHWRNKTPIYLLKMSTEHLRIVATKRPHITFHLPCPAISNGGLDFETVKDIIKVLPDNVLIYKGQ